MNDFDSSFFCFCSHPNHFDIPLGWSHWSDEEIDYNSSLNDDLPESIDSVDTFQDQNLTTSPEDLNLLSTTKRRDERDTDMDLVARNIDDKFRLLPIESKGKTIKNNKAGAKPKAKQRSNALRDASIFMNFLLCCSLICLYVIYSSKLTKMNNNMEVLVRSFYNKCVIKSAWNYNEADVYNINDEESNNDLKFETEKMIEIVEQSVREGKAMKKEAKHDPEGRKVWTGEGLTPQAIHIAPKNVIKYEEICNKPDEDLIAGHAFEYCTWARELTTEETRKPIHTHNARNDDSQKQLFKEDFIDPNVFNPIEKANAMDEQNRLKKKITNLLGINDQDNSPDSANSDYDLNAMDVIKSDSTNAYEQTIPQGFNNFEDALKAIDNKMKRLSFYSNSCHTKYLKMKADEENRPQLQGQQKKFEKHEIKRKHKKEEKRVEKRDKRDKREKKKIKSRH